VKAAERRVGEVIRAAGEQREQAERELADAAQTVDDLEDGLDQVKAEREALQQRLTAVLAESQQQAVELAQLRERLAAGEKAARAVAEQLDQERNDHSQALERAAAATDTLRFEIATLRAQAEAAAQAHQEHRKEAAQEAQRCADKLIEAQQARDALAREAATAREDAARLAGQLEALQEQNARLIEAIGSQGVRAR
jgi:chromosome segregation ATPase